MTLDEVKAKAQQVTGARLVRALNVHGCIPVRYHDGRRVALVPVTGRANAYYRVTGSGCNCPGFTHHGFCKHFDCVMLKLADGSLCPQRRHDRVSDEAA